MWLGSDFDLLEIGTMGSFDVHCGIKDNPVLSPVECLKKELGWLGGRRSLRVAPAGLPGHFRAYLVSYLAVAWIDFWRNPNEGPFSKVISFKRYALIKRASSFPPSRE
jgi:hypothetical protein